MEDLHEVPSRDDVPQEDWDVWERKACVAEYQNLTWQLDSIHLRRHAGRHTLPPRGMPDWQSMAKVTNGQAKDQKMKEAKGWRSYVLMRALTRIVVLGAQFRDHWCARCSG